LRKRRHFVTLRKKNRWKSRGLPYQALRTLDSGALSLSGPQQVSFCLFRFFGHRVSPFRFITASSVFLVPQAPAPFCFACPPSASSSPSPSPFPFLQHNLLPPQKEIQPTIQPCTPRTLLPVLVSSFGTAVAAQAGSSTMTVQLGCSSSLSAETTLPPTGNEHMATRNTITLYL